MFKRPALLILLIALAAFCAPLRLRASNNLPQSEMLPIEVFQVLDLPLDVHEAARISRLSGCAIASFRSMREIRFNHA
jgi:hypothetical protein